MARKTCPVGPLKVVRWPRPPPRGPCAVPHLIVIGVALKNKVKCPHRLSPSLMLSRVSGSNERSTRLPKRVLVLRTRRTRVILGTVAFLDPPPPHHSTPSVCLNKGPTR